MVTRPRHLNKRIAASDFDAPAHYAHDAVRQEYDAFFRFTGLDGDSGTR